MVRKTLFRVISTIFAIHLINILGFHNHRAEWKIKINSDLDFRNKSSCSRTTRLLASNEKLESSLGLQIVI